MYSAHPSCSPSVFFTHPDSKYTPLEKPLEKIPPSPTPHAKNIQPRPPLQTPLLFFLSTLPSFASLLPFSLVHLLHASPVHYLTPYLTLLCDLTTFFSFFSTSVTPFSAHNSSHSLFSIVAPPSRHSRLLGLNTHPSIRPARHESIHPSTQPLRHKANQLVDHPDGQLAR